MEQPTKELTLTRVFDAPREPVFKAWTNPEILSKWWGPNGVTNPECEIDARVGGKLHIVMLAGKELGELAGQRWPMQGIFEEIDAPNNLVFSNQAIDEAGNVLLDGRTTALFEDENGKTKLTVTTFARGVAPEAPQMLEGMEAGWSQSLDKLKKLLSKT